MNIFLFKILAIIGIIYIDNVSSSALQLNSQNFDSQLSSNELVFVNYYANWCRFSQMLEPIFDEFADKIASEFPAGKLSVGKVDCDTETQLASSNNINKYPTLKLYRYGVAVKKEFRGARTVEAFISFIKEQITNPVKVAKSNIELSQSVTDLKKRMILGYFESEESENFKVFTKLASMLRDSCAFVAGVGDQLAYKRPQGERVVFRNIGAPESDDLQYSGQLNQYEALYGWANERCTPLVREITFENAEELTEEGLPFLILFHKPDDLDSIKVFEKEVQRQLSHVKNSINSVHADGLKFSHPLHHLGKSAADLPILAIDSFRHMYLFPDFKKLTQGESLLRFVQDLHSGKLHREFHNGPDPTSPETVPQIQEINQGSPEHIPKLPDSAQEKGQIKKSTPPESVFIKLAPSRERYSIKEDL